MLNVNDWSSWLSSPETNTVIRSFNDAIEQLKDALTDGSHIQEKSIEKISLDYTYSLGQIDGIRAALDMMMSPEEEIESGN